jgi:GTP cyclohydrolase I
VNRDKLVRGARLLLEGVFEGQSADPDAQEILASTPERVADALALELLTGYRESADELIRTLSIPGSIGPVTLRAVRFTGVCAHHLLPFRGVAHLGYVPRDRHVGIGTLARLVDVLSRRMVLQEPLTARIADALMQGLEPLAVVVCLECEHECAATRGARKEGHRLVTLERRGQPNPDLEWMVLGRGAD